ncbi:MAG: hypothetical protein ACOYNC_14770 [Bacteroidales bacterium]
MRKCILSVVLSAIVLFSAVGPTPVMAQKKQTAVKIGTYDSRIVTFAWSRSELLKQHMVRINQQVDSAEKANDTARVKELTVGIISYQHLLHQMVFSNGSVALLMDGIRDKLPELAKTAGVSLILSKWEVSFSDPSFELVDLTAKVAALFQPKESIDQMSAEISKQPPVPLDELTIETEMLDGFCQRFGKK